MGDLQTNMFERHSAAIAFACRHLVDVEFEKRFKRLCRCEKREVAFVAASISVNLF